MFEEIMSRANQEKDNPEMANSLKLSESEISSKATISNIRREPSQIFEESHLKGLKGSGVGLTLEIKLDVQASYL